MAELAFDVVDQILIRLDVKDLLRFKSVCKSWYFFISSPRFVKDHLRHACKNDRDNLKLGRRRICSHWVWNEDDWFTKNFYYIVGSCDGLVCISPVDLEFVVTNPSTREVKKVQTPPFRPQMRKIVNSRQVVCWGFGYDSSIDDYKVIAGFRKSLDEKRTLFHALTLKSNIWKFIGEVNCKGIEGRSGILLGGALHWIMVDKDWNKVIWSLDLSTEEFKEIPVPDAGHLNYKACFGHRLGVLEDSLCIYDASSSLSTRKFVMKNNKWELYNYHCERKYDVAHFLTTETCGERVMWGHDDGKRVPCAWHYIRSSVFVKSLVSPHLHANNKNNYYGEPTSNAKILETQKMLEELESITTSTKKGNMSKRKRKRIERRKRYYWDTLGLMFT